MEENNIQKSGQIKEKQSVKYRLKKNVAYVTNLTSIAALVAIIALLIVGKQYSNALTSYGFIQGDIGKAMTVLVGSQSSVRATIGYLDESAIKDQKNRYKQKREKFDKYFKNIEVKQERARNLQRVFRLYSVRHHSVSLNSQKVISRHHSLRAIMKMNLTI